MPMSPGKIPSANQEQADRYDEAFRTAEFRKSPKQEQLLAELNGLLSGCQDSVNQGYAKPQFPLLLIMGVPRSGTTLFYQWLAESRRWGYPSNIVARFFGAPYIGARVQQILIENDYKNEISVFQKTVPYQSSLGKTIGALAPAEFWYFWRRFFPLDDQADVVPAEQMTKIDVARLNAEIASLEAALEKPIAMKAMLLNWHIPFLDAAFDRVIFVQVRRDALYVMQSLMEGRLKNFGTEDRWYAFKPPEYAWLKELDPVLQVAGQVYFTEKAVQAGLASLPETRKLVIDYQQFCQQPAAVWEILRAKLAAQGYALEGPVPDPDRFEATTERRVSAERWERFRQAFQEIQQMDRER